MATSSRNGSKVNYDAVVIGAGVIGLSAAWRAAKRGLRVLVLDPASPGSGATGVAAGMLAPVTEATFGEEDLLALNLESAHRYRDFVAELEDETGIDAHYRPSGTLAVALDRDDAELLRQLHGFQIGLGLEAEWLRGRECRDLEPGLAPGVVGGIKSALDHQVRPRSLVNALVRALDQAGVELRRARADGISVRSGAVSGVKLDGGEAVSVEQVVVAAGWQAASLGLPADSRLPVRPVKGQIVRLAGAGRTPIARRVVRTPEVYVVPRDDGEVVVGATVEERGPDTRVTAGGVFDLLRAAYRVLPGVTELELVETAAGLRPASPDNKPVIGRGNIPGLVWATAHWRNGILLAPVTADAVAELLTGQELPPRFASFSPERFARPTPSVTATVGERLEP